MVPLGFEPGENPFPVPVLEPTPSSWIIKFQILLSWRTPSSDFEGSQEL